MVPSTCRRIVAWAVVLTIAAIHVVGPGTGLSGVPRRLYSSYASDVMLPLAMYFVLCLSERNLGALADWRRKATAVLAAAFAAETLQALGVPVLGRTFDSLDFAMYAIGVLLAVLLDRVLVPAWCGSADRTRGEARGSGS